MKMLPIKSQDRGYQNREAFELGNQPALTIKDGPLDAEFSANADITASRRKLKTYKSADCEWHEEDCHLCERETSD